MRAALLVATLTLALGYAAAGDVVRFGETREDVVERFGIQEGAGKSRILWGIELDRLALSMPHNSQPPAACSNPIECGQIAVRYCAAVTPHDYGQPHDVQMVVYTDHPAAPDTCWFRCNNGQVATTPCPNPVAPPCIDQCAPCYHGPPPPWCDPPDWQASTP